MHNAAMKATYVMKSEIPQDVIDEVLASEGGEKALKKFIKRDVLFEQELATAEKAMTVEKFLKGRGKQMNAEISVKNLSLFLIE